MSNTIQRRAWLRQTSLAIAGFTFAGKLSANPNGHTEFFLPPGPIRLSSNENPYGPSPMARKAMADAITLSNRYPWDYTTSVREQIAGNFGLSTDNVLMGAGSSEILGLVAYLASFTKGNAVTPSPSFQSWVPVAQKMGLEVVQVPLTADKKIDLPAMRAKINNTTQLVYICNPNNPTGTILPAPELKSFVEEVSKQHLVLLDEAYMEYCDEPSLAPLVASNKNIIVAKTFSKIYGLAGARVGYALAHPDTITRLGSLQAWPNAGASMVSLAAASASLKDKDFLRTSKENNRQANNFTFNGLKSIGFDCIPSNTNFLYYSAKKYSGNLSEVMRSKNIIIGRSSNDDWKWTRTTIGTMEEMQAFINAAKQLV